MKIKPSRALFLSLLIAFPVVAAETVYQPTVPEGANPCAVPSPRDDWYKMVQDKFTKYGNKHAAIVFDGDSITNRWESTGKQVWEQHYAGNSADFGIEGDRIENVLWRLSKGQVDGVDPKVIVLMIGTNNSSRDSADQIAEGIKAVVADYEKRCPQAHIILMAVFPRSAKPTDNLRQKLVSVNQQIASLDDGKQVSFVDIGPKLLEADGTYSASMAPDFLHPGAKGYEIWSDAIQPIIDKYVQSSGARS